MNNLPHIIIYFVLAWKWLRTTLRAFSWEQRKLGDEATEMIAGGDVDKELLCEESNYPVIANALTGDGIIGYYKEQYRIKAPAVTVTGRGDVGHAKARNIDFTPVVRLLSIKSNHNPLFLENAINTLRIVVESTGVPQLTVPQLAKYELMFPKTIEEETEIGNLFSSLDNLITLHQRERLLMKGNRSTEAGEGTHNQINVLILQLLNNMEISLLRCCHACMA